MLMTALMALFFLLENYSNMEHINLGTGQELSIWDLIEMIKSAVGFKGETKYDNSKPDGTPRKLLYSENPGIGLVTKYITSERFKSNIQVVFREPLILIQQLIFCKLKTNL